MEIVGFKTDPTGPQIYVVECDTCNRRFEVADTLKFAKCSCGTYQRLLRLIDKFEGREETKNPVPRF